MRLVSSRFSKVLEIDENFVASVVLEDGAVFRRFLEDLHEAAEQGCAEIQISEDGRELAPVKVLDIVGVFVPFTLNQKSLLAALVKRLEKLAMSAEYLESTHEILGQVEKYLRPLTLELPHEVLSQGLTIGSVIKASGMVFAEEDVSLSDRLIDYFRLVREFEGEKLFVLVNSRSYFAEDEMLGFLKLALESKFRLLLVDSSAKSLLPIEKRLLVDEDLCEIADEDDEELPLYNPLRKC